MNYKKELRVAKLAAKEAGDFLMKKFKKPRQNKISFKEKREIVTKADIGAEKIIRKIILKNFLNHDIIGEELKPRKNKSDFLWLIDPLDGTNNFAHGLPIFAVCIALAHKDKLTIGVVYIPCSNEMFWAEKGKSAYLNNKKIKLSKTAKLKDSFVLTCFRNSPQTRKKYLKIFKPLAEKSYSLRHLGSAGYELISVARGHLEGGLIMDLRPWDGAAGALIVKEAGGKVTNFDGKPWKHEDKNILFSNGKIHKELLNVIIRNQ